MWGGEYLWWSIPCKTGLERRLFFPISDVFFTMVIPPVLFHFAFAVAIPRGTKPIQNDSARSVRGHSLVVMCWVLWTLAATLWKKVNVDTGSADMRELVKFSAP